MISQETFSRVIADFRRGVPKKAIARKRCLSRTTVRKILSGHAAGQEGPSYERSCQGYPRLEKFRTRLEEELEKDAQLPLRHRRRLTRIFEALQGEGYAGGYDSVRRYARVWRGKHGKVETPPACAPMTFKPAEAYQFDWSEEHANIKGVVTKIHVAQTTLCYSRMTHQRAYLREQQEMVFDAHAKAFESFGGACERGIYDNMKTVVVKVQVGKERTWNRRFLVMGAHYGVEIDACTPFAPQEKGRVERRIQTMQNDFFYSLPKAESLEELNQALDRDCRERAMRRPHPDFPSRTVFDVYQEERPLLIKVAGLFDGYGSKQATVTPTLLVHYDNNAYSVDCTAKGRSVEIRAYADHLGLLLDGKVVGEHRRSFKKHDTIIDVRHYIPVLERKPGAVRNGLPLQDENLPSGLARARLALERHADGMRQLANDPSSGATVWAEPRCRGLRWRVGQWPYERGPGLKPPCEPATTSVSGCRRAGTASPARGSVRGLRLV